MLNAFVTYKIRISDIQSKIEFESAEFHVESFKEHNNTILNVQYSMYIVYSSMFEKRGFIGGENGVLKTV